MAASDVRKIDPDFKRRVSSLAEKGKAAARAQKESIILFLDFCREYFTLYEDARTSAHRRYLHQQTKIDEPSLRSAYKRIGEQYAALKKHIAYLPPSQESLKELARAERRKEGTITRLVDKHLLGRDSSVSEVRAGVRKLARAKHTLKTPATALPVLTFHAVSANAMTWEQAENFLRALTGWLSTQGMTLVPSPDAKPYEALEGEHQERIRRRAERAVQRLIHAAYQERLRRAHKSIGVLPVGKQRNRLAEKKTGLGRDEVYGGVLSLDAALFITNGHDVERFRRDTSGDGADRDILLCAEELGVGEKAIADAIVIARESVKESKALLTAREWMERTSPKSEELDAQTPRASLAGMYRRRRLSTTAGKLQ